MLDLQFLTNQLSESAVWTHMYNQVKVYMLNCIRETGMEFINKEGVGGSLSLLRIYWLLSHLKYLHFIVQL